MEIELILELRQLQGVLRTLLNVAGKVPTGLSALLVTDEVVAGATELTELCRGVHMATVFSPLPRTLIRFSIV